MSDSKKMDETEFNSILSGIITKATSYIDEQLSPLRAEATDYYKGEKLGNEEDGRSQFVVTEVRDGVIGVLPSILRVVFGAEKVLEFAPRRADSVAAAEQATDYIQSRFELKGGFLKTHSVLKDGLVRRLGIFKWWWDENSETKSYKLENIPESKLVELLQKPGVKLVRAEETSPPSAPLVDPSGAPMGQPTERKLSAEVTVTETDGSLEFDAVPPEEIIFCDDTKNSESALFIGHRTRKTKGELIAMGIEEKVIDAHGGDDSSLPDNAEAVARNEEDTGEEPEAGEANDKILYIEGWARIDYDGDGIAELRRVCTIGTGHYPVSNEPASQIPLAFFCPDPEPHTMNGQSWADRLMDLQRVKSMLTRSVLDSLALSIFSRMGVVEGQANMNDVLNTEIGAPIRIRRADALVPIKHDFTGREALPLFDYFDNVTERRVARVSNGAALDSDALQSSTKSAVGAAINGAQEQSELLCRIFVEGTLKPMFRGMLQLFVEKRPEKMMVRQRGQWIEIDPRSWDADMDMEVKVAIGSGFVEQKIAVLQGLTAKMELVFQTLGPTNPIFTFGQYAYAIKKAMQLSGIRDTTSYINDVPLDYQPPPQEPQKSPEQVLAEAQLQVEKMRVEKELMIKQAELTLKTEMAKREHEAKLEEMRIDAELRKYEIDLKYQAELQSAGVDANLRREEAQIDAEIQQAQIEHEQTLAEHERMIEQQKHEQELKHADEQHQAELSVKEAEAQQAAQGPATE